LCGGSGTWIIGLKRGWVKWNYVITAPTSYPCLIRLALASVPFIFDRRAYTPIYKILMKLTSLNQKQNVLS
jgi:hypothetical protein